MTTAKARAEERATEAGLNDFAIRSFRDVADQDYIAARLAYRHGLYPQFHWSALQAVEKYLKGILLLNRIPAKNLRHHLDKALKKTDKLPFEIKLSDVSRELIRHLDRFGQYRYLESSYYVHGPKLIELDRMVWEIRRYCQRLNYAVELSGGRKKNLLQVHLAAIQVEDHADRIRVRLPRGLLEKIIDTRDHIAREPFLWKNLFYGTRVRRSVRIASPMHATNAPLTLHPDLLDEVLKYVFLPKEVVEAYRQDLARRSSDEGLAK